MIDILKKGLQDAGEALRQQANTLNGSVKDKAYAIIEDWLSVFPELEKLGLRVTSFALSIAISPGLDVECIGAVEDFSEEKIDEYLKRYPTQTGVRTVLQTIKTTMRMNRKARLTERNPLILKISVRLNPEIRVFLGEPRIE